MTETNTTPWFEGFQNAEVKSFAQAKGWEGPEQAIDSYRNLEKLAGVPAERLLKLPEKPDAPEWVDVWGRLGRPAKAEEYGLKVPEGSDPEFAKAASGWFHEAGIPKGAAAKLNEKWNAYMDGLIKAEDVRVKQKMDAEMGTLKSEWGQEFDARSELGRRSGREFGVTEDQFKAIEGAIGTAATMKMFHSIGTKLAEPKNLESDQGQGTSFGMTPEQAKQRIVALQGDKDWIGRYLAGGKNESAEMTRLQQAAYQEKAA